MDEAKAYFLNLRNFEEAREFAESYNITCWMEAVYKQVLHRQNFRYFEDYFTTFSVPTKFWLDVTDKFKSDPNIAKLEVIFKNFLKYLDDDFVKYKIAAELGFRDVVPKDICIELYKEWIKGSL